MDLKENKAGAYVANALILVNAGLHFALAAYIYQFSNSLNAADGNYYTRTIPTCSYIIVTGIFMVISAIISICNFCGGINFKLARASWFFGWIITVLNFGAGVIVAIRVSFYHQLVMVIGGLTLPDTSVQFRAMYKLYMADAIYTFVLGFTSSIALTTMENYHLALAKIRDPLIMVVTDRRQSQMQRASPVVQ